MLEGLIEMALRMMAKALKTKKGKVYRFLMAEKTRNTIQDFYFAYVALIESMEDTDEEGEQ